MNAKWITPAVTAFNKHGEIDLDGNADLYYYLIAGGIDGILILGSIGEFFAIPMEEKKKLILHASKTINKAVPLYVGTGSMIKNECIELSNFALKNGADAVVIISPYYFQLPETSQFEFYSEIASHVNGPIILYNFPERTGYNLSAKTVLKLVEKHKNIVGIKDTTNDMSHTRSLIHTVKQDYPYFAIYSGFDEYFIHNLISGGDGCIAGIANFAPHFVSKFVKAAQQDDWDKIMVYQKKIDTLMNIYNIGSQFIPIIKEATIQCGVCIKSNCSFPLSNVSLKEKEKISLLLKQTEIIM